MARLFCCICCVALLLMGGCASDRAVPPAPAAQPSASAPVAAVPGAALAAAGDRYRCDQGVEFTVRFADGEAIVDAGFKGKEVLLRDAGGTTPQQTVYTNARLRAEFGLGAGGNEAVLHFAAPVLQAHCVRG